MSRLTKKQHFWEWFNRNNHEYLSLENKSKKDTLYWFNELEAHIHALSKFLHPIIAYKKEQPATLTITANGKAIHFKKAEDLVAKAPVIPGWTFAALEEIQPIDYMLDQEMLKSGVDPREMFFSIDNDDPDNTILTVYHPLCTPKNENLILRIANGAVYNLLGERSFGNDIAKLYVENLSNALDDIVIEKLEALPAIIGKRNSGMIVNSDGSLLLP
jgi:hypothetical protein